MADQQRFHQRRYRKLARFEEEGMESLFGAEAVRLIVDLKAEYPGFNPNEIANAAYVRFGRRPDRKTVRKLLEDEPIPLRFVRRFPPYEEVDGPRERRLVIATLYSEGWSAKAIAGYLEGAQVHGTPCLKAVGGRRPGRSRR